MMNLFYRGYVIHEDVHAMCYTIFDRRPDRLELVIAGDSGEAMTWIDRHVHLKQDDVPGEPERIPWLSWVDDGELAASA